jgi:hypothetical protein
MTFSISESSENIKALLHYMSTDRDMRKRFEGKIAHGEIDGYYFHSLSKPWDISLLKVDGDYDIEAGKLNIKMKPTPIFYAVVLACQFFITGIMIAWAAGVVGAGALGGVFVCLFMAVGYVWFIRHHTEKFKDLLSDYAAPFSSGMCS